MGRFNEYQRQVIGTHVTTAKLMPNKNNVQVVCDNNENGKAVWNIFKQVYPEYSYNTGDTVYSFGGWIWGDYKTFRVLTGKRDNADSLLEEINSCLEQYGYSALNNTGGGGSGGGNTYQYITYQQEDKPEKESTDLTTYIIIGAAAAIILLLLWDKKKK